MSQTQKPQTTINKRYCFFIKLFEYQWLFLKVTLQLYKIMISLLNRPTRSHSSTLNIYFLSKTPIQYRSIFNGIFTKNKFQDGAFS